MTHPHYRRRGLMTTLVTCCQISTPNAQLQRCLQKRPHSMSSSDWAPFPQASFATELSSPPRTSAATLRRMNVWDPKNAALLEKRISERASLSQDFFRSTTLSRSISICIAPIGKHALTTRHASMPW